MKKLKILSLTAICIIVSAMSIACGIETNNDSSIVEADISENDTTTTKQTPDTAMMEKMAAEHPELFANIFPTILYGEKFQLELKAEIEVPEKEPEVVAEEPVEALEEEPVVEPQPAPAQTIADVNAGYWEYARAGLSINITKYIENGIVYWVANVYTANPDADINTALSGGSYDASMSARATTSSMASANNAIFAVNGDECGFRGYGTAYQNPIVIRNGVLYYEDSRNIGPMCALKNNGELQIFSPGELGSGSDMVASGVTDVWWFDCPLVENGVVNQILVESESAFSPAPYTAIGQKDNNNFIFIAVDGRGSNGSAGVTYTGMARLMQRYGAVTAYQLDGGGSTTIWFNGTVLNAPSDGAERAISDIIYVAR